MYTLEEIYNKIDSIYAANNRTIVSQYIQFALADGDSLTVMTVPADRIFILTDVVWSANYSVYITENGIADKRDELRPQYIMDHLKLLDRAINEKIDLRGYFHWALIDNYEWAKGFKMKYRDC